MQNTHSGAFVRILKSLLEVFTASAHKDRLGRRILMSAVGILLTSFAVALQKKIALGVDPFSVLMFGISEATGVSYGIIFSIACVVLITSALVLQRSLLGISTLIVLFLNGYFVDFFCGLVDRLFPAPDAVVRGVLLVLSTAIFCVAAALYYTADLGVSPYDAQALSIDARTRIPFKYARILTDVFCTAVGFLLMLRSPARFGYVGIATIVCAFGLGPIVTWCRAHISEPLLRR